MVPETIVKETWYYVYNDLPHLYEGFLFLPSF